MEALLGSELLGKSGPVATAAALAGKTVGLYFSAHWCVTPRGTRGCAPSQHNNQRPHNGPMPVLRARWAPCRSARG